jgi:UDPglucose 6-dehydrogenase
VATARAVGYSFDLLREAIEANEQQFDRIADRLAEAVGGDLSGRRIAVWGLAFKAGTDDLSDSPALEVASRLVDRGADVVAHDPAVSVPAPAVGRGIRCVGSALDAVRGADALVVLTEWPEFAGVDPTAVAAAMAGRVVFDTRNVLDAGGYTALGLSVVSVGRPRG